MTPSSVYEAAAQLLLRSRRTVALTGAGVSTASGIPDFRGAGGLWRGVNPEEVASISAFRRDKRRFWEFYAERLAVLDGLEPNAAHVALSRLESAALLEGVVTQNIDGLHQAAGSAAVHEVHGHGRTARCSGCAHEVAAAELPDLTEDGVPRCPRVRSKGRCRGALRPNVVLFGETLDRQVVGAAVRLASTADVMICAGTSLQVFPVASWPQMTLDRGGKLLIFNAQPTPYDDQAVVRFSGDLSVEIPRVVDAVVQLAG